MTRRLMILLVCMLTTALLTACGNDDSPAPLAPAPVVVDSAPPAPPAHMVCCNEGTKVKVAWETNLSDPDFVGFRLTRTAGTGTVTLVDYPADIDRFVDDHPFEGQATYAVTAVDASGNESAATTMVHDFFGNPPPRPVIH